MITQVRTVLVQVLELLLWLVGFLALLQVLFGTDATTFFGMDVVGNIGAIMQQFGNAGLVGLVAAIVIAYLILRAGASLPRRQGPGD
jgi:hypothetical protein